MIDGFYAPPKPAIIVPHPPQIVRPYCGANGASAKRASDPLFVVPAMLMGGLGVKALGKERRRAGGYGYWRVTFTTISGGDGSNACSEVYAYLGANATGTEVHTSATASGTCVTPSTANNGAEGGSGIGGTSGTTLIYTFPSGTDLLSMKFKENTDGGYAQRTYAGTIAKSTDGSSWTDVQTFSGQSPTVGSGSYTVTW